MRYLFPLLLVGCGIDATAIGPEPRDSPTTTTAVSTGSTSTSTTSTSAASTSAGTGGNSSTTAAGGPTYEQSSEYCDVVVGTHVWAVHEYPGKSMSELSMVTAVRVHKTEWLAGAAPPGLFREAFGVLIGEEKVAVHCTDSPDIDHVEFFLPTAP